MSFIPLQQALDMTARFRNEKDSVLDPVYRDKDVLPDCETFNRSDFDKMLSETDCVKVRVYYGMDKDLGIHAIIVGVNSKDEDILPPGDGDTIETESTPGVAIEEGVRCPPICPPPSPLHGG